MSEVKDIKKLRQLTGAGFTDCSAALKDSNGDIDKAIEILKLQKKCLEMLPKVLLL